MRKYEIDLQWDGLGKLVVAGGTAHSDPESEWIGTNLFPGGTSVACNSNRHSNGDWRIASVSTCCIDIDVVDSFPIC